MTPRVVLVTGATGLVGARTLRPLADLGFEVVAVSRSAPAGLGCRHVQADLLDPAAARAVVAAVAPTHILHCAWEVTHGRFWHAPENLDWVGATLALARAAVDGGVARFVGVGTCTEYDWSDGSVLPRRESDPAAPASLYATAKHATHQVLDRFFSRSPVAFAWGRVFNLFGPGEPPTRLVPSLLETLRSGRPYVCQHGQLVRDYMAVEDAGDALARLTASAVTGAVNIASGEAMSLVELTTFVADRVGARALLTVDHVPAPDQALYLLADVTRLRQEVGAVPAAGLTERLGQFVAHGRAGATP